MKHNLNRIGYILFLNLSIIMLILVTLNYFKIINLEILVNEIVPPILFIAFLAVTILSKYNLDKHRRDTFPRAIMESSKYFFISLILILAANIILNLNFINQRNSILTFCAIVFGILALYKNKDLLEEKLENEKKREDFDEKNRYENFHYQYNLLNKIWGVRNILRWIHMEGIGYFLLLSTALALTIIIRLWSLNYIDGLDNFTIIAVKNAYENGISFYKYSILTPLLMLNFSKLLGYNMLALRLPSIIYSAVTLVLIYFIAKRINKKVAIISSLLFAISPWSIIVSRFTRDYAFDSMVAALALLIAINIAYSNKTYKKKIILILTLFLSIIVVSLINRREQALVALIMPMGAAFSLYYQLLVKEANKNKIFYFLLFPLAAIFYFISYSEFKSGIRYNGAYLSYLFNPNTQIAWQWFNGNHLSIFLVITIFFIPLLSYVKSKKVFQMLYTVLFVGLALFILKFVQPSTDIPSRYIYFLFPVYVILFSSGIFLFSKIFDNRATKTALIILLAVLIVNPTSLIYSIDPVKAYKEERIENLQIDNLGTGRFEIVEVSEFIKNNLEYDDSTYFVFDKKFAEFIYLLDLKMDGLRNIISPNCTVCSSAGYDISQKTYVESAFWNIHEIEQVISQEKNGYFITREICISDSKQNYFDNPEDNCILRFSNSDFNIEFKEFKFITNINGYKIYQF